MAKDCVPSFENYKKKFPEFKENIECVENYLNLYDWFTQNPNNRRIKEELFQETLKMMENGIESLQKGEEIAAEALSKFSKDLVKKYPKVYSIKDNTLNIVASEDSVSQGDKAWAETVRFFQENLKSTVTNNTNLLRNLQELCQNDDSTAVECIETFVSSAHSGAPYISLGCGIPYFRVGMLSPHFDIPIGEIGSKMAKETNMALNCIRYR